MTAILITLSLQAFRLPDEEAAARLRHTWRTRFIPRIRRRSLKAGEEPAYLASIDRSPGGFVHLHAVIVVPLSPEELRLQWFECGGGCVVDARPIGPTEEDLSRCVAYVLKGQFGPGRWKGAGPVMASKEHGYYAESAKEARRAAAIEAASSTDEPSVSGLSVSEPRSSDIPAGSRTPFVPGSPSGDGVGEDVEWTCLASRRPSRPQPEEGPAPRRALATRPRRLSTWIERSPCGLYGVRFRYRKGRLFIDAVQVLPGPEGTRYQALVTDVTEQRARMEVAAAVAGQSAPSSDSAVSGGEGPSGSELPT